MKAKELGTIEKELIRNFIRTLLRWEGDIREPYDEDYRKNILYAVFEAIENIIYATYGIKKAFYPTVADYDDGTEGILIESRKIICLWRGSCFPSSTNERIIDKYLSILFDCWEQALENFKRPFLIQTEEIKCPKCNWENTAFIAEGITKEEAEREMEKGHFLCPTCYAELIACRLNQKKGGRKMSGVKEYKNKDYWAIAWGK